MWMGAGCASATNLVRDRISWYFLYIYISPQNAGLFAKNITGEYMKHLSTKTKIIAIGTVFA